MEGRLCYLPESHAFGFGIAALICLSVAQIIGNVIISENFCSKERRISNCNAKKPLISTFLLLISWLVLILSLFLLSAILAYLDYSKPQFTKITLFCSSFVPTQNIFYVNKNGKVDVSYLQSMGQRNGCS